MHYHFNFSLGSMATTNLFFNYERSIALYELKCSGNETNIWESMYNTSYGGQICGHYDDASVFYMREFKNTML